MGIQEAFALVAIVACYMYALSRVPPLDRLDAVLGGGPNTVWVWMCNLLGIVLFVWALRIGHLVFFPDDG